MTIITKVYFTDLEIDPVKLANRWHRGTIPLDWKRYIFSVSKSQIGHPINKLNRWMYKNLEGRWSVWTTSNFTHWEIHLAFENNVDAMTFVLAGGETEAFIE